MSATVKKLRWAFVTTNTPHVIRRETESGSSRDVRVDLLDGFYRVSQVFGKSVRKVWWVGRATQSRVFGDTLFRTPDVLTDRGNRSGSVLSFYTLVSISLWSCSRAVRLFANLTTQVGTDGNRIE